MSTHRGSPTTCRPNRPDHPPALSRVPLVAVIGGCGGAGASTLAVSLAVTALGNGWRAVLFDADPLGGGLEQLVALATSAVPEARATESVGIWPHIGPARRPSRRERIESNLTLVRWACPDGSRVPAAGMRDALRALRHTADLVVVDLPRVVDDSAHLVLSEATNTLIIAPVSERAAVATARLLPKLSVVGPRAELLARLPSRDNLTPPDLATILDTPLAGVIRPGRTRALAQGSTAPLGGNCAGSLERFSRRFLERCALTRLAPVHGDLKQVSA